MSEKDEEVLRAVAEARGLAVPLSSRYPSIGAIRTVLAMLDKIEATIRGGGCPEGEWFKDGRPTGDIGVFAVRNILDIDAGLFRVLGDLAYELRTM